MGTFRLVVIGLMLAAAMPLQPSFAQAAGGGDKDRYVAPGQSDFEKAVDLIKAGSYEEAMPLLASIVRDNPKEADSLYYLGYANERLHNYQTAFDFYTHAVKADPDHKQAHEGLGLLLLSVGQLDRAIAELDELKRICAVNCEERQLLATRIGQFKDAQAAAAKGGAKGKDKPATTPTAKQAAKPKTPPDEDLTTLP